MEKTLEMHLAELRERIACAIEDIDLELEAREVSADYLAATKRAKMILANIARSQK